MTVSRHFSKRLLTHLVSVGYEPNPSQINPPQMPISPGMKVGSLFSGIGGIDLGLQWAGMKTIWFVEKEKYCQKVLTKHWPGVPIYGDIKEIDPTTLPRPDLLCGGFPCQDLSVAGKREGLAGERSGLWFEFLRIIDEIKPQWVLIENVPGLLSSNRGRDFTLILQGLAECGYCAAWRILNAQYFGVPQRRRRVFIVASLRAGSCAQVLFEPSCGCWDSPPGREKGEEIAGTISGGSAESRRGYRNDLDTQGAFVVTAYENHAQDIRIAEHNYQFLQQAMKVRRLTPTECLRLQGLPDNWINTYPPLSDSAKYRMIGNSVAVPVIEWIGRRIMEAANLTQNRLTVGDFS